MHFLKRSGMATHSFACKQAIPAFTHWPHRASPPICWHSFYRPTEGRTL